MSTGGVRRNSLNRPAIYAIVHLESGWAYIGQAYKWWQRWLEHRSRLTNGRHNNPHLQAAFKKYGAAAFRYALIEWCAVARLTEREAYWMAQFEQRTGIYNAYPAGGSPLGVKRSAETRAKIGASSRGRNNGRKHTPEELEKMSAWQRGRKRPPFSAEWRAKIGAAHRGKKKKPPSVEVRARISATLTGRKMPEETKRKIRATLQGRPIPKHIVIKRIAAKRKAKAARIAERQLCLPM